MFIIRKLLIVVPLALTVGIIAAIRARARVMLVRDKVRIRTVTTTPQAKIATCGPFSEYVIHLGCMKLDAEHSITRRTGFWMNKCTRC